LAVDPGAAFGDHHVLARIEGPEMQANYLPVDEPVPDALPYQRFRVRFRLHNAGTVPITKTPQLEFRPEVGAGFVVVPEQPTLGIPLHVAREWVPSPDLGGGTIQGPLGEDIPVANLRIGTEGGSALTGHHSMATNPDRPITMPSSSYTEEEFTVELTMDAQYLTGYELRITDGGTPLTGTDVAVIRLGAPPVVQPTPGERQGVPVVPPTPSSAAAVAYPLLSAPPKLASATTVTAVPAAYRPNTLSYPLVTGALSAATATSDPIHGPYTLTSDQCESCHRGHVGQSPNLLVKGSQSALCFSCHDGTTANTNVRTEYHPVIALPANDSTTTTRDYYSHDAEAPSNHTLSGSNEFGSKSERHSECADCHNSHKATTATADSVQAPDGTGWTASGRLSGVSGVSVLNSPTPDAPPAYTFLSGVTDAATDDFPAPNTPGTSAAPITHEYQLCFKCHSSFTTLLPNIAGKPSTDALDKAAEFNPNNASFHPVEAPGKNQTPKMTASLAGPSTYKLWNFTIGGTVRCLHCHANGATLGAVPPLPLPGTALAPHTSSNRGILLANYRDRVLSTTAAAYNAGDFALCYTCHSDTPFAASGAGTDRTNYWLHGLHTSGLGAYGSGTTNIDTPGAGQGNAICAECHFRLHSTTYKVPGQVTPGTRLVNFAPDVIPSVTNGIPDLSWEPNGTGHGSCYLSCHGVVHKGWSY
jgi:predicted CXXCH cytochrome family protein